MCPKNCPKIIQKSVQKNCAKKQSKKTVKKMSNKLSKKLSKNCSKHCPKNCPNFFQKHVEKADQKWFRKLKISAPISLLWLQKGFCPILLLFSSLGNRCWWRFHFSFHVSEPRYILTITSPKKLSSGLWTLK